MGTRSWVAESMKSQESQSSRKGQTRRWIQIPINYKLSVLTMSWMTIGRPTPRKIQLPRNTKKNLKGADIPVDPGGVGRKNKYIDMDIEIYKTLLPPYY